MLGDVLRLSWSISLGSLLPSSLRLRPSKLSRSEGDCGRGRSCWRRGRAIFPFPFPSLLLDLGPPSHKITSRSQHTTVPRCDEYSCSSPPPCHPGTPPLPPQSLLLPSSRLSSLKCPSLAPSPNPQLNPNPCLPPAHLPSSHLIYPFN